MLNGETLKIGIGRGLSQVNVEDKHRSRGKITRARGQEWRGRKLFPAGENALSIRYFRKVS